MDDFDATEWVLEWAAKRRQKAAAASGIPYCSHVPTQQQKCFLDLQCPEALYGGAAGGGKSDAMLMAALQYVDRPGYAAILFRRTFKDLALPGAIMARSHEWLAGTEAHWRGDEYKWTFPSGATLSFGYLDSENDRFRYQSAEFQFVGFDELTQFPERWYLYLFSRLRRLEGSTIPLRMRSATNPGGLGHKWVKARFGINADGTVANNGRKDRVFVPAKLDDNPHVDRDAYRENLSKLDPVTREQLEKGRWIQDSSGLVYASWHRGLVVPQQVIDGPARWHRILSFDFGNVNDTAWGVIAWPQHARATYVLESHSVPGLIPSDCAGIALEADGRYRFDRIVGDVGGLGKGYAEEMRRRFAVPIEPAEKTNKLGYIKLLNGAFCNAEAFVCAGNEELCSQLEELPWHDEQHSKEAQGFPNHLTDMYLYGWRAACAYWERPDDTKPAPPPGSREAALAEGARLKEQAIKDAQRRANADARQRWGRRMVG